MKKLLLILSFIISSSLMAQGAYFHFSFGPDAQVKKVANGYQKTRFRTSFELGSRNFGFVLQPAFGNSATSLFLAPKFMIPFQIGNNPLFIIPDFSPGLDFGFNSGEVGLAMDLKFNLRAFYEFQRGLAVTFKPFGLGIRPFNVWFGDKPNQTKLSVTYEVQFGFAYFF